jgi:membrane-bound metal-dependent hydrolase YbcI (DUF457 family)
MPNRETHMGIAFILIIIIGKLFHLQIQDIATKYFAQAACLVVGSVIPDFLDPPRNPYHRKFFHSKHLFKALFLSLFIFFILSQYFDGLDYVIAFVIGYVLHLFLDFFTPMGLPKK